MEVVKRLPLYKSNAVADRNDHKLYWIDVVLENGIYKAVSYAQLFSRSGSTIKPGAVRQYVIHSSKFIGDCIKVCQNQLRMKELRRGYRKLSDREKENITATPESIIAFLLKYG